MTKRFRMIAGPNGSGKSTLADLLRRDYAVNFYAMLNADDIFAEVSRTHAYLPALPVDGARILREMLLNRLDEVKRIGALGRRLDSVEGDIKQIKGVMSYLVQQLSAPPDPPRRRIGFGSGDDTPTKPYGKR